MRPDSPNFLVLATVCNSNLVILEIPGLGTGIFLIGDRAQVDTKIDRPANRLPVQNKRRAPWTGNASVSYEGIFLERAGGQ